MPERLNAAWLARLAKHGAIVQEQVSTQIQPWLFGDADRPELPWDDIYALSRWCRVLHDEIADAGDVVSRQPAPRPVIEFVHQGRPVRETFVEIAPNGLTGIISEPAEAANGHAVRLLMSTVGPGRTFADFARDEAGRAGASAEGPSARARVFDDIADFFAGLDSEASSANEQCIALPQATLFSKRSPH